MADGRTIVVVKAIAAGRTASVIIRASGNVGTDAMSVARIGRAVYGIDGAGVGVVASGGTIAITPLTGFHHPIATKRVAIPIAELSATGRAAVIIRSTRRHRYPLASHITGFGTSN